MPKKNTAIKPTTVGEVVFAKTKSGTCVIGIEIKTKFSKKILVLGWMNPSPETKIEDSEVQAHTFPQTFITDECKVLPLNAKNSDAIEISAKIRQPSNSALLEYINLAKHALSGKEPREYQPKGCISSSYICGFLEKLRKYFPKEITKVDLGENHSFLPISPMAA